MDYSEARDDFIRKSIAIHGDLYDYSKVVYKNNKTKVTVTCRKHGDFQIRAVNHYSNKAGCPLCNGGSQRDTPTFISLAKEVHGSTYDYSLVDYKKNRLKVKIICKKHGVFEQEAGSHLKGYGCNDCGNDSQRHSKQDFIKRSQKVHGDLYDYSLVEYISSASKVSIVCKKHGVFEQVAYSHMIGQGCGRCSGKYQGTTDTFIERAREVHGSKYDYSLVEYTSSGDKVSIVCKDHGVFLQTASSHLNKRGCPTCPRNNDQPTSVYILTNCNQVKIGISCDPQKREKSLSRNQPFSSSLEAHYRLEDYYKALLIEKSVHKRIKQYNSGYSGFDGATEWFNVTPEYAEDLIMSEIVEKGFDYSGSNN